MKAHLAEMTVDWLADLDDDTCFVEACQLVLDNHSIAVRENEQDEDPNNQSCQSAFLRDLLHAKLSILLLSSLSARLDQKSLSLTPSDSLSHHSKAHLLDAMMVALHSAQRMFSHSSIKPHHLHTVTPILKQLWTYILRYYPFFPQHGQGSLETSFSHPFNLGGGYGQPIDTEMVNAFFNTFLFESVDTPIWLAQRIQKTMRGSLTSASYAFHRIDFPPKQQVQSLVDQWIGEFLASENSGRDNECLVRLWALATSDTERYFGEQLPTRKMGRMLADPTNPNANWFIFDMIDQMLTSQSSWGSPYHRIPFFVDLAVPLWDLVNRPLSELSPKALTTLLRFMTLFEGRRREELELGPTRPNFGETIRMIEEATRPFFNMVTESLPMLLASVFVRAKEEWKSQGGEEMVFDENKLWGGVFEDLSCLTVVVSPSLVDTDAVIILLSLFKMVKSFHSQSLEEIIQKSFFGIHHTKNSGSPIFSSFPLPLAELTELQTLPTVLDFLVESHVSSILTFDKSQRHNPLDLSEAFLKALPSSIATDLRLVIWFKRLPRITTAEQLKAEWQSMVGPNDRFFHGFFAGRLPAVIGIGYTMLMLVRPERVFIPSFQHNYFRYAWTLFPDDVELIRLLLSHSSPSQMMSLCALLAVRLMELDPQQELWMSRDPNSQNPVSLRNPSRIREWGLLSTTVEWKNTLGEEGVEDVSEAHFSKCALALRWGFGVNSLFKYTYSYQLRPVIVPEIADEDEGVVVGSLFD
ncbi:hypothetical protein BLNAU_11719 [Blattamonas nauphoetae]|uniref:Uncharacterized protein n=1 Tax=Blattamonas nauphoetae TaxID=2049346 RepID=A0ABQ9XLF4_9EUKA|nr:hypothetical protein BLNAU_11719 [Blattamonas nauphoetae]